MKNNPLTQFFETIAEISMTEIPLHLEVGTYINKEGNRVKWLSWWIAGETKTRESIGSFDVHQGRIAGSQFDYIYPDDLDENKLTGWTNELHEYLIADSEDDSDEQSIDEDHAEELALFNRTQA